MVVPEVISWLSLLVSALNSVSVLIVRYALLTGKRLKTSE